MAELWPTRPHVPKFATASGALPPSGGKLPRKAPTPPSKWDSERGQIVLAHLLASLERDERVHLTPPRDEEGDE